LRSFWIRLDNQIGYSLFSELPQKSGGTKVIMGPDNWFYEAHYNDWALKECTVTPAELQERAATARRAQDKLAAIGLPLVVVVAPVKVSLYPEHLPDGTLHGRDLRTVSTLSKQQLPLLRQAGVSLVDGTDLLRRWKSDGIPDLFAPSGTHWSYLACERVWREIHNELAPRMRRPLPPTKAISINPGRPAGSDRDLIEFANFLWDDELEHPVFRPEMHVQHETKTSDLPRLLWVNDSFGWPLIELLYESKAAQPSDSLYYYANRYALPEIKPAGPIPPTTELAKYLAGFDAVIVVCSEAALDFDFWGFFKQVDSALPDRR
jgi:hypothetical protein